MMRKILILQANPNKESFGASLAQSYRDSAKETGHEVEYFDLVDLKFDYNLLPGAKLEADLVKQQELIGWADEVVITAPVWWMSFPAVLKAYFDRVLTSGFAFKYPHPNKLLAIFKPQPLLKGKKLRLISAQDGPLPVYWLLGDPFTFSYRFGIFSFVGFKYRRTVFSLVRGADEAKRDKWREKVVKLATKE